MPSRKSSVAVSRISSAASPALSSMTQTSQKSSVMRSAFTPSSFQLSLFASVIQGLGSEQLRVHDTHTGRLRCEFGAEAGTKITSLDWGFYSATYRDQGEQSAKRKRKRGEDLQTSENAVVAIGTSQSDIHLFSPSEGKVVKTLGGSHTRGIHDFKFTCPIYTEGWSIGGDGKLVQWSLPDGQAIRNFNLPESSVGVLGSPSPNSPQVLFASSTPYTVNLSGSDAPQIDAFDAFRNPVISLQRSSSAGSQPSEYFLAADSDRYINVYSTEEKKLARSLITGSEVESLAISSAKKSSAKAAHNETLAVVTKDGSLELFTKPFDAPSEPVNGGLKSKRKNLTRKADAVVKIMRPGPKKASASVLAASLSGSDLLIAWADHGVNVSFERIRYQDEQTGLLLFEGIKEVLGTKAASTLQSATMNGVKDVGKTHVDESRTVVMNGISAAEATKFVDSEASSDEDEEESEEAGSEEENQAAITTNGVEDTDSDDDEEMESDADMEDVGALVTNEQKPEEDEEDNEAAEPSFGELLAAKNQTRILISDALVPTQSGHVEAKGKSQALQSGISLSTVLTQSLRTNDQNLLESCFHTTDISIIKLTIQRLDSSLAGILLEKLAERLARKPGRYGNLLIWIQWICIAHGGALAGRPKILSKITTLYQVLNQRSKSLDNLLLLKGKLDMLDAQITLRRQLIATRGPARDADDDEDVIYIEGEEDYTSDEDVEVRALPAASSKSAPRRTLQELVESADESSEADDDDDMPTTNGMAYNSSDDEEDDSSEAAPHQREGGLLDDEAEESNDDSHPSDNAEESDEDELDSDEEDSEMDDFINDGEVSVQDSESDLDVDDTPEKPAAKKSKHH